MTAKKNIRDYLFVGMQFVLFGLYVFEWLPRVKVPAAVLVLGITAAGAGLLTALLSVLNLNRNLTVFPTPKKNAELVQTGLYRWVRHPIYSGILLSAFAFAAGTGSLHKLLTAIALLILFYFKTAYEEKRLAEHYREYADYRKRTGRFFPKFF